MILTDRNIAIPPLRQSQFTRSAIHAGDVARDSCDWSAAADSYRSHLASNPEDVAVWMQLGYASRQEGDFSSALEAYRHALSLMPADADLLLNVGHLHRLMGNFAAALDAYGQSARLAPSLAEGAALIQIERLAARLEWRHDQSGSSASVVTDYAPLLDLVKKSEVAGRGVFSNYFRSFEAR